MLIFHFHHPLPQGDSAAFVHALAASAQVNAKFRFDRHHASEGVVTVAPTVDWVDAQLASSLVPSLSLSSAGQEGLFIRYHSELSLRMRYVLTITADEARPLGALGVADAYLQAVALAYGATIAAVFTTDLLDLQRFGVLCGAENDPFSSELAPEVVATVPRSVVERISSWTHPSLFDPSQLPEAIGWINYWAKPVVERLGRDAVRAQPWLSVAEDANGGMLLVTSTEPPSREHTESLERVAQIVQALGLNELKENDDASSSL